MCSLIENLTCDILLSDIDNNLKNIEKSIDKIPEIGLVPSHCLKNGQLVRFRGMIQDMADPVLYLSTYEVVNSKTGDKHVRSGKYKDTLDVQEDESLNDDSSSMVHSERRSVYCVSVPGLNNWAKPKVFPPINHESMVTADEASCSQVKRSVEEMEQDSEIKPDNLEVSKKQHTETKSSDERVDILLNHPIEAKNNYSCLINVYEDLDEELIKINSVVDVIGFVSFSSDCDDFSHLPATLVPRLHAVSLKAINNSIPFYSSILEQGVILSKVEKIRKDLMHTLKQLFLGDSLSAEYALCNLISRVYHRNELLTLGHFSINITNVPLDSNYPKQVYDTFETLVPKSHYLPLSLEMMNSQKFLPEKDYEHNCLKSGILQLSNHTHLFVDETKMDPGQLNSNGVLNVKALNELIIHQKSNYDFKYVKIEFPVDVPVLVMSEGKSMFSTSVQVILSPEAGHPSVDETMNSVRELLKEPFLTEVREYLHVIMHSEFKLAEDLIGTIQRDYVKLRQEEKKVTESDLHLLLILARLICSSFGQNTLTKEMWDKTFEMELFRKERINNREP